MRRAQRHLEHIILVRRERLCEIVVKWLPANGLGNRVKFLLLRFAGARVAWPLYIDSNVWIRGPRRFSAGPSTVISRGAVINCAGGVELGPKCLIGYYAFLGSAMHVVPSSLKDAVVDAGHDNQPIVLGGDCWIGAHACVLAGVSLGTGAIVGAGAVVTKDIPKGMVVVGPSARELRVRE